MQIQNQYLMKKQNQYLVLETIRKTAPISRIDLSKITKMSPTTITRVTQELIEAGYIEEKAYEETSVGRRPRLLGLIDDAQYTIGIDIDKQVIRIGVLNFSSELVYFKELQFEAGFTYEVALESISVMLAEMFEICDYPRDKVLGIGIGVPGAVNHQTGEVVVSEQLKWKRRQLSNDLEALTDLKVIVDNELKMQIHAEVLEEHKIIYENCLLIGIGSGIGASIMIDGEVYRGINNNAGEISHMTVNPFGDTCHCGNIGCLSTYYSESIILRKAQKYKDLQSLKQLVEEINHGEQWAIEIEQQYIKTIAIAINNLVCSFEPKAVIVTGELVDNSERFQKQLKKFCEQHVWNEMQKHLKIIFSKHREQGVVIGAGLQAEKQLLNFTERGEHH